MARREVVLERRAFLGTLAGSVLAAPLVANSQAPPARARIGVFFAGWPDNPLELSWARTFVAALGTLGWAEGQNLVLDWRRTVWTISVTRSPKNLCASSGRDCHPEHSREPGSQAVDEDYSGRDGVGGRSHRLRSCREPRPTRWQYHRHILNEYGHDRETAPAAHRGRADCPPRGGAGESA